MPKPKARPATKKTKAKIAPKKKAIAAAKPKKKAKLKKAA